MLSEREILLRNVKCAAAREGFISFHFLRKQKISQWPKSIISHFASAKYFTETVSKHTNLSLKELISIFFSTK